MTSLIASLRRRGHQVRLDGLRVLEVLAPEPTALVGLLKALCQSAERVIEWRSRSVRAEAPEIQTRKRRGENLPAQGTVLGKGPLTKAGAPTTDRERTGAPMAQDSPLATELAFFERQRADLLQHHAGKFVLIKGEDLIGAFDTPESAYEAGIQRFGNVAMLIRQVVKEDPVQSVPALMHGILIAHP